MPPRWVTRPPCPLPELLRRGSGSVRGYRRAAWARRTTSASATRYGGNFRVVNRLELLFPVPDKWKSAARVSWFFDVGNVFQTGDKVKFLGADDITPVNYHFTYDNLKRSTGIAVSGCTLGLVPLLIRYPFECEPGDTVNFEDETERFQFSIGQAF